MEESFSFYCKFQSGATISALCLDRYVSDNRPIACIGSQEGEICIYYLDHRDMDGKRCQRAMYKFSFFQRGPSTQVGQPSAKNGGETHDNEDASSYKASMRNS